jgi:hypothetical protein
MKTPAFSLALTFLATVGSILMPAARAQNHIQSGIFENGFSGCDGTFGLYHTPNPVSGSTVGIVIDIQDH